MTNFVRMSSLADVVARNFEAYRLIRVRLGFFALLRMTVVQVQGGKKKGGLWAALAWLGGRLSCRPDWVTAI